MLVFMDYNLIPYLTVLLVVVLYKVGDLIRIPKKRNVIDLTEKFLANKGAKIYDNYGALLQDYRLHVLPEEPVD